ncbi:hypothetical protein PM682P4_00037 [Parabacteroides phage PM682P4]|nr:hypothetical protein PM682P4_00037 [Parabacteroides phage PM682P4]
MAGRPKTRAKLAALEKIKNGTPVDEATADLDPEMKEAVKKKISDPVAEVAGNIGNDLSPFQINEGRLAEVLMRSYGERSDLLTVDECIAMAVAYFNWVREHPILTTEYVKSGLTAGTPYVTTKYRAVSLGAFCLFAGWSLAEYKRDTAKASQSVQEARSLIDELIIVQQDEGALAGIYSPEYMSKLRGLGKLRDDAPVEDKKPMTVNVLTSEALENLNKLTKL